MFFYTTIIKTITSLVYNFKVLNYKGKLFRSWKKKQFRTNSKKQQLLFFILLTTVLNKQALGSLIVVL